MYIFFFQFFFFVNIYVKDTKAMLLYSREKNCARVKPKFADGRSRLQDIETAPVRGRKRNWPSNSESNKREILIVKDN